MGCFNIQEGQASPEWNSAEAEAFGMFPRDTVVFDVGSAPGVKYWPLQERNRPSLGSYLGTFSSPITKKMLAGVRGSTKQATLTKMRA